MSNYHNLMAEVDYICKGYSSYGTLDAIMFIKECEELYPSEVRRELKEFLHHGAKMFAPVDQ
jgi:hypothetical protein